ncbi:MAG: acyl-CoA dehydrogenase family protein [Acidimicrobiales bacterium]|jgi:alkylation response protein AidB-like acyl-CoA dehydrogenase
MDFDLSADQVALRDGARQLLDHWSGPEQVRTHLASGLPYDSALWAAMVDQGWPAVAVAEDRGGLGLGWIEAVVLLEEIGRHTSPVPFASQLLALDALDGDDGHRALVTSLVEGAGTAAVAWSGRSGAVEVRDDGDRVSLTGRLGPVEGAAVADVAVVVVPDGAFLVDLVALGRPRAEPAMDVTRTLSWLTLDGTPATRTGGPSESARLGALGALATSAELLGGAGRVLEMATAYAKDRVQFGAPIGSFQAVKHRCADMLVDVEGMRSATWYAAWAAATGEPGWELASSTAKVWCADASKRVMSSGLQVHGGIGFTWEHDLHLFIKRAQFSQLDFGDAAFHRSALATGLRERVEAGIDVM